MNSINRQQSLQDRKAGDQNQSILSCVNQYAQQNITVNKDNQILLYLQLCKKNFDKKPSIPLVIQNDQVKDRYKDKDKEKDKDKDKEKKEKEKEKEKREKEKKVVQRVNLH